ncbi:MAG: hypothetical protein ACK4V6_18715, partial [Microthrixaceae bacterium]
MTSGVQPRYEPDRPPLKSLTWPDNDQDAEPSRVSITRTEPRFPTKRCSSSPPGASPNVTPAAAASTVHANVFAGSSPSGFSLPSPSTSVSG